MARRSCTLCERFEPERLCRCSFFDAERYDERLLQSSRKRIAERRLAAELYDALADELEDRAASYVVEAQELAKRPVRDRQLERELRLRAECWRQAGKLTKRKATALLVQLPPIEDPKPKISFDEDP